LSTFQFEYVCPKLSNLIPLQLRLSISHSLNEAIGEKDEEDADVDVASLTRLQARPPL
jgi:hypothetical protein